MRYLIKDTKTGRVLDTVLGLMADAIQYMADHGDLRDHAGIFTEENAQTTKS